MEFNKIGNQSELDSPEIDKLEEQLRILKQKKKEKRNKQLQLGASDKESVKIGVKRDGREYSVRDNRDRYFFPNEWIAFYGALKPQQQMTFNFLINTGARVNEAINVKVGDIDIPNKRLILRVTKVKAAKREKTPRPRMISISSGFARELNKYIKDNKLKDTDLIGLLSAPAGHIAMKGSKDRPGGALLRAGIKDWYMFSIHNIRKTHGNWLKAMGIDGAEICTRLGHDYNTFLKSYASADVFTLKDKQDIRMILGDLYSSGR